MLYTLVCLAIFLVCSQLPLYGVKATTGADPLYWARVIMASSRGTVMELGIGPTVTAGLVIQLLVGSKLLDVDTSVKEDRDLMCGGRAGSGGGGGGGVVGALCVGGMETECDASIFWACSAGSLLGAHASAVQALHPLPAPTHSFGSPCPHPTHPAPPTAFCAGRPRSTCWA